MINYTNMPTPIQGVYRDRYDAVILTSRDVPQANDYTQGLFYKEAVKENTAFPIYMLSEIQAVPNSATNFFIKCQRSKPGLKRDGVVYLCLVLDSKANTFGYRATDITILPPTPN